MHVFSPAQAIEFVISRFGEIIDSAGNNPFSRPEWIIHFLREIPSPSWQIIVLGERKTGFCFLYRDAASPHQLRSLANYYTSQHGLLRDSWQECCKVDSGHFLELADLRPRPATILLSPLAQDRATSSVQATLSSAGWYVRRFFAFGNWYLPCSGLSFGEYMAGRDARLRNTWSRKAKRFQRAGNGARLELVTEPAAMDAALEAFRKVYAASWKSPEPFPNFVPGWARICVRERWLRLGLAWIDDVPVAAQFWFTIGRIAYIYKLAYDEAYRQLSAGTVLSAMLFQYALEVDKVAEVDYLTGDDDYKSAWVTHRRERVGMLGCNLSTGGGLAAACRESAGDVWRRLRPRTG